MPGPKPPEIVLSGEERAALERLARAHTTGQQLAARARIVLLAAEGLSTSAVARTLGVEVGTARQWRARWREFRAVPLAELSAATRLADAPKAGAPARISPEQVCQIVAVGCERPADADRPISQWSARAGRRGHAAGHRGAHLAAPCREVAEKRPTCSRTASGTGSPRPASPTPRRRSPTCVRSIARRPAGPRAGSGR